MADAAVMPTRRVLAALALVVVAACSSGTGPAPAQPAPEVGPTELPGRVLSDAQDVADRLNQREADLESLIP